MKRELKIIIGLVTSFVIPVLVLGQTLTNSNTTETNERDAETEESTPTTREEENLNTEDSTEDDTEVRTTTTTATTTNSSTTTSDTSETNETRTTNTETDLDTSVSSDGRDTQSTTTTSTQNTTSDPNTGLETNTRTDSNTRFESQSSIEPQRTLATSPEEYRRENENRQRNEEQTRESLVEIGASLQNLDQEARELEGQIRTEIKNGIDDSIIVIREQRDDIQAFELQREVDAPRTTAFNSLESALRESAPNDPAIVSRVASTIEQSIVNIENNLRSASSVSVDLADTRARIAVLLEDFEVKVTEYQMVLNRQDGELLFVDSDGDGLSDYEEIYIYNTDASNANTTEGDLNDSEKVAAGLDPTTGAEIRYQDPREDDDEEVVVSEFYRVDNVQKVDEQIKFTGRALPNSYATIYIFSTPVIVTVQTDDSGRWTYTLDKELENGQHEIYVATVNNSGRIMARSSSNPFINSAEAATLGSFAGVASVPDDKTGNFFQDNFLSVLIVIILIGIVITMLLFGKNPEKNLEAKNVDNQNGQDN